MPARLSVAIPVRNGGPLLEEVLRAVRTQEGCGEVELVVADSRSTDGSRELAKSHGARVLDIAAGTFSHGGTRNLLMREARGDRVAFLTQDATPADPHWLRRLTGALDAPRVGLACGPYRPRRGTSVMLRRELTDFFAQVSAATHPVAPTEAPEVEVACVFPEVAHGTAGPGAFHTDANAIVARWAWERVPFREVAYAEDQLLARDMAAAGVRRAFVIEAAVLHSHDLPAGERFRRWFDEFRALREVHGVRMDAHAHRILGDLRAQVRRDRAFALRHDGHAGARLVAAALAYHGERRLAGVLGSRADALPPAVRRSLSAEGRAGFSPVDPDPGAAL